MEPREFVSIEIPFKLSGDTKVVTVAGRTDSSIDQYLQENPCVLPPSYRDALATRRQ